MHAETPEACEREAIHLVEQVQPFGVLLAVAGAGARVARASANASALFGRPVLGVFLHELFAWPDEAGLGALRAALAPGQPRRCRLALPDGRSGSRGHDAVLHAHAGWHFVEIELPEAVAAAVDADLPAALDQALEALRLADGAHGLCRTVVDQVAMLTGYHRVMVYRFDPSWCGEVVAESCQPGVEGYLGQRFPASDIPAQARQVFVQNWLRIIPDAAAAPVPIVATAGEGGDPPLDLSYALLRAVSPIHCEYLANMRVAASMTISLQQGGKLWGLVACHHRSARFVAAGVRQACAVIGRMASSLLAGKQQAEDRAAARHLGTVSRQLAAQMARGSDLGEELLKRPVSVLDLIAASGAAAYLQGSRWSLMGRVPPLAEIIRLVQWLAQTQPHTDVYACAALSEVYPPARAFEDVAAGLLAVAIPKSEHHYVLWFRPEVVQTTTWAGDPRKATGSATGRLHPRASFARWRETVRHRSLPWSAVEQRAAASLREAIIEIDLRRQFQHERRARAESDGQRSRFAFLAAASAELAGSLHDEGALQAFARLITEQFCDWMAIYFTGADGDEGVGSLRRHIVWHRTEEGQRVAQALRGLPGLHTSPRPQLRAVFAGETGPLCVARTSGRWIAEHAPNDAYARFIRDALGMQSLLLVPMVLRGRFLGVVKLVRAQPLHRFLDADVGLACELARQIAQSRDNALLYAASKRAIAARDHVIGVVSHDLKTPIGAIQLNVDGLRRRLRGDAEIGRDRLVSSLHQGIDRIGGAAQRMYRLIDDILNVTQVEAGTLPVEVAAVPTAQIVRDVLDLMVPLADDHGVSLHAAPAPSQLAVRCDSDRIMQVLTNLISNALKFTPRGGEVVLTIVPAAEAEAVCFCVRDTGPGIDAAALPHVFDRFWRARHTARMGAGLGLAIAKGIVEAHGGRIWVHSEVARGAAFYFTLPRERGRASAEG